MKEGVIDVLMYIFSSYADQDENLPEDRDGIDADWLPKKAPAWLTTPMASCCFSNSPAY